MPINRTLAPVLEVLPRPPAAPAQPTLQGSPGGRSPFLPRVTEAIQQADHLQHQAARAAEDLATGDAGHVHEVILALEKADLALQLTVQVTQKAVDAYREISRMQV